MTSERLLAYRANRSSRPVGYSTRLRSTNVPILKSKSVRSSMVGFLDGAKVEAAIIKALREGDRDPTLYVSGEVWLKRAVPEVSTFDPPHLNAVFRDPRVRAVISEVGGKAVALLNVRRAAAKADTDAPTTLGWRLWSWDAKEEVLRSPSRLTPWHVAELRAEEYQESGALRGVSGIHALRVPVDWRLARWPRESGVDAEPVARVTGIVERYGRYVLGTEGWRAEWVFIRKLLASTTEVGLALEQRYPEVEVCYANR